MTLILDGKKAQAHIFESLKAEIIQLGRQPSLAIVQVGDDPASTTYIKAKLSASSKLNIASKLYKLPKEAQEQELLSLLETLNHDITVDAILLQQPLPSHMNAITCLSAIKPNKDVDGLHPLNQGKLWMGIDSLVPCTALGIIELLKMNQLSCEKKHAVIVGRSNLVGKPVAALLCQKKPGLNATVTIAHSQTPNLASITKEADILIAAVGSVNLIQKEMVKPGAIVIDVGINTKLIEGKKKLCGDVNFDEVAPLASAITPVPGGVGPMTVALLMKNILQCARLQNS